MAAKPGWAQHLTDKEWQNTSEANREKMEQEALERRELEDKRTMEFAAMPATIAMGLVGFGLAKNAVENTAETTQSAFLGINPDMVAKVENAFHQGHRPGMQGGKELALSSGSPRPAAPEARVRLDRGGMG